MTPEPEIVTHNWPQLLLMDAGLIWLDIHRKYVSPRTASDCVQCIRILNGYFGTMKLEQIEIEHLRAYQNDRQKPTSYTYINHGKILTCKTKGAGAERINKELGILQQILKEAGLWHKFKRRYKPLPVSREGKGRALTHEEEHRLLRVAFRNPNARYILAAHCMRIMLRSGMGFGELRKLRRKDVNLDDSMVYIVEGAKNSVRMRPIPLTPDAMESMFWIIQRWEKCGGSDKNDFVLFHKEIRIGKPCDFTRPMGSIKKGFAEILKQAGIKNFRIYDCRVTAVTRALSSGKISLHTAERLFGHISIQMQRRYFRPDLDLLRSAVTLMANEGGEIQQSSYAGVGYSQNGKEQEATLQ